MQLLLKNYLDMSNYVYFQPTLVELFAKQKLGSMSSLLERINKDGSWWFRSKKKPTIKIYDIERLAKELNVHPTEFFGYGEDNTTEVEEPATVYASLNAEISARIAQLVQIKTANNQTNFAESTNISKGQISNIIARKHSPGFGSLTKILKAYPDVNARWLLMGEGGPLKSEQTDKTIQDLLASKDEIIKLLRQKIDYLENK